jgi:hypothetical protein
VDPSTILTQGLDSWFQHVASTLTPLALQAVTFLLFQTPDFTGISEVRRISTLTLGIADALLALIAIGCGVLVMASGTFETLYTIKRLLPRLVLAAITANASLALCSTLTSLDNALVSALAGSQPLTSAFNSLVDSVAGASTGEVLLSSLLAIAVSIAALLLAAVMLIRDLILLVATVAAPLALICYGLPQLDQIARLWWRIYAAALFIQVIQALLFNTGVQLAEHTNWLGSPISAVINDLLLVVLLYLALLLPFAAIRWVSSQGWPDQASQLAMAIKAVVAAA